MTLPDLIATLEARTGAKGHKNGDSYSCRCPAHQDSNPSLAVSLGDNGRLLVHCHAGCTFDSVCAALGLAPADLAPPNNRHAPGPTNDLVATYRYTDEAGALLFEVLRTTAKTFPQRRPDGRGGWEWGVAGVRRVLYRLPALLAAVAEKKTVFVCEGEKDVEAMAAAGFAATCNPGGAGKWREEYGPALAGADVVVIADKDTAGRAHADQVAKALHGTAARVRVLELPNVNGTVKDAHDFFATGGTAADLWELAEAAPAYQPHSKVFTTGQPGATAPTVKPLDEVGDAVRRAVMETLTGKAPAWMKNNDIGEAAVAALRAVGYLYHHADHRSFDTAMFFAPERRRLELIHSDSFTAWFSDFMGINRSHSAWDSIAKAVENSALQAPGILPEAFWAARPGAYYISSGDGAVVRITAAGPEEVANGTDGVLFPAGSTLAPWRLTEPACPFAACRIFHQDRFAAAHGPLLARLWLYSLPTTPRCKPPIALAGDIGSGKTRLAKGFAELYGVPFLAAKPEEDREGDFWVNVDAGGLFTLDNADTRCKWLADTLAAAATDGCSKRRKLYTNSDTNILRPRAWLAITTANPLFASDAGLADRLLVVRMQRSQGETSDAALADEIASARDAGLSHIAHTLAAALADGRPVPHLNARHPDFAATAVKIGRALGLEAETIAALTSAEADKHLFCLENDTIGAALQVFMETRQAWKGNSADLLQALISVDKDIECNWSAKRIGKRINTLWPHIYSIYEHSVKSKDRKGFTEFTISKTPSAEFAEFLTAIPTKSA